MVPTDTEDHPVGSAGSIVLEAKGITKRFRRGWWPGGDHTQVLRGADMELRRGEIVGLVGENFELFGRAYGLSRSELDHARTELYETFGFGRWADTRVEALSGGTRSKLNLGLAMVHDPDLLLLDEPYAGFDWETYQRFWEATASRRNAGRTLLIISHFIADEERFDRIIELRDGTTAQR